MLFSLGNRLKKYLIIICNHFFFFNFACPVAYVALRLDLSSSVLRYFHVPKFSRLCSIFVLSLIKFKLLIFTCIIFTNKIWLANMYMYRTSFNFVSIIIGTYSARECVRACACVCVCVICKLSVYIKTNF